MMLSLIVYTGLLSILAFIFGLLAIVVLFGIINRTKETVRLGFIFIFFAMVSFVIFGLIKIFENYQIIAKTLMADFALIVFTGIYTVAQLRCIPPYRVCNCNATVRVACNVAPSHYATFS